MTDGQDDWVYVVIDIEVDGPWRGPNSMRSFASVAVTSNGEERGISKPSANLSPVRLRTYAWFQSQPEAWAAATTNPHPIHQVMTQFVAWVRDLPGPRMFAASPIVRVQSQRAAVSRDDAWSGRIGSRGDADCRVPCPSAGPRRGRRRRDAR